MWVDLSEQIAADFATFPSILDAAAGLTVRGPDLLERRRAEGFLDHVEATAGLRDVWTMVDLLRALGLPPDAGIRVGLALRVLGWACRRRHGGARVYRRRLV